MDEKNFQLLKSADYYFRNNNYTLAENILKKIIKILPNNSKANELLGYIYGNTGNLDLSFQFLKIASEQDDCSAEAMYYYGSHQLKRNLYEQAIGTYKKSIEKAGIFFEALHDLGTAYSHLGQIEESLTCYEKCLALKKDSFELNFNIARCLDYLKRYEQALFHYDQSIQLKPDFIEAWLNKGATLNDLGRFDEALFQYEHVIKLNPAHAEAWACKGGTLNHLKRFDEALFHYDQAINLRPNYPEVCVYKGVTLNNLGRHVEALFHYDEAIRLKPDYAEALSNKGVALDKLGRSKETLFYYDEAIRLKPDYAEAWLNKGEALKNLGCYEEALFHYDAAIRLKPDYGQAILNRALLKLNLKNFDEGWKDFEARNQYKNITNFEFPLDVQRVPVWVGDVPCKHLLIVSEQGIGDQIFYLSMLKNIQYKVEEITVIVDPRLISIFSRSFPSIKFLEKKNICNKNIFDAQIPMGNIPIILNVNSSNINGLSSPYLIDDPALSEKVKNSNFFQNKFTCGISWKSSNVKIGNQKSINFTDLKTILQIQNCEFINLQYGDISDEMKIAERITDITLNVVEDINVFEDIDGLLSIINSCDIVITTSNITAHMAGASGKKTLLLLPYSQGRNWYWHQEEISTWYPSIKQFFQNPDLTWNTAINKIIKELRGEIERKN